MAAQGSKPAPAAVLPPKGDGRRRIFWALYTPPLAALVLLVVVPLLLMAVFSFRPNLDGNLLGAFPATLKNYASIAGAGVYVQLLLTSMLMAAIIAGVGTLLAYPVAYFLAFRAGPRASAYLLLLL